MDRIKNGLVVLAGLLIISAFAVGILYGIERQAVDYAAKVRKMMQPVDPEVIRMALGKSPLNKGQ